jgi:hypothetical protein
MWGLESPLAVVKYVEEKKYRASRLDWAHDVFNEPDFYDYVLERLDSGHATMRFKSYRPIEQYRIGHKLIPGRTIEFGRRVSDTFCRLYDKKAERLAKHADMAEDLGFIPDSWHRLEFVFKRANARRISQLLAWEEFGTVQEIILGLLDLKDEGGNDAKRSRWPTTERWQRTIAATVSRTLGLPAVYKRITAVLRWFEVSVAPSLSAILHGSTEAGGWLDQAIASARSRWRHAHYGLMAQSNQREWPMVAGLAPA